jgi:hypothetical protein
LAAQTLHIALDVRVDGDEISGHACEGEGKPKPFSGWLGLIGALDGLLNTPRSAGEEPAGPAARSIRDPRSRADRDGSRGGQQP